MASTKIINVLKDDTLNDLLEIFNSTEATEVIFVLPKKSKFLSRQEHFSALATVSKSSGKSVSILCSNQETNQKAITAGFHVLEQKKETSERAMRSAKLAVAPPPSDDDVVYDSEDAFQEDVIVPSDEKIGISDAGEEEVEGMHIIEPEKDEDEKEAEDKDELDDIEDEEDKDTENAEELSLGDMKNSDIEDFYNGTTNKSAGFSTADIRRQRDIKAQTAVKMKRGLDAIFKSDIETKRSLKVQQKAERPSSVEVSHSSAQQGNNEEIESVWQDVQPADRHTDSLWNKLSASKTKHLKIKLRFPRGKFLVISGALLLALGAGAYAYPEHAIITVKPASKPLDMQTRVEFSDSVSEADLASNKIPGQVFTLEHTVKDDFKSTGQKEVAQKARGIVTVYNEYGSTPQILIATTRFESDKGLVFRTLKTISVPGTRVENGKIIPGKIDVEVIADKPGAIYNIGPGKFTIPAFKEKGDTDRFQKFYGQSDGAFSQGISGLAKVVTEADYSKAKEAVTSKLKDEFKKIINEKTSGLKLFDSAEITVKSVISSAEADQAAETFSITAVGSVKTMGYKEADIVLFIQKYVKKNQGLLVLPEKITYSLGQVSVPADKNSAVANLQVKGTVFADVDTAKIASELKGKSESDLKIYLKDLTSIASAKVNIQSLWGKNMPKNESEIKVELLYEN